MGKVKIGIIGTGGISHMHMAGYKQLADIVDVVALCDIDKEKVEKYAEKYGVPLTSTYTDYNEMLKNEELDAVSVCTWNKVHMAASVAALNAKVNVLCEKPMAMNEEEAKLMQKAADDNGKLLMIGFVRRFGNDAKVLEDFIKAGTLGDLYYAKCTYLRRNGCPGGWFGDKEFSGGGPLIDLGVHVMDLTRYLAGCPKPVSAYAITNNSLGMDRAKSASSVNVGYEATAKKATGFKYTVEDFASAMIKFDNGLTMLMEASFNLNIKQDTGTVELFGTKGGAKLDPGVEIYTDVGGYLVDVTPTGDTALSFNGLFEGEIAHFVDCVKNGTTCRAPMADGVMLMKMIDAIYESARTNKEVMIEA